MSAHGHIGAGDHHADSDQRIGRFRLELVIAVLLGLAAIVGALAAY